MVFYRKFLLLLLAIGGGLSLCYLCFGSSWNQEQGEVVLFVRTDSFSPHESLYCDFLEAVARCPQLDAIRLQAWVIPSIALCTSSYPDRVSGVAICDAILNRPARCIITVGRAVTALLAAQIRKRDSEKEMLFIGVDRPIELGVVESLDHPGCRTTGLFTIPSPPLTCAVLIFALLPSIRSILVPYYSSSEQESPVANRIELMKEYFLKRGVLLSPLPVEGVGVAALQQIEGALSRYDMVLTLEDDSLAGALALSLAEISCKHQKPYFSDVALAVNHGALFTYALNLRYSAIAAADLLRRVVCEGCDAGEIPVVQLTSSREFVINTARARELDITLDLEALERAVETDPALACVKGRIRVI